MRTPWWASTEPTGDGKPDWVIGNACPQQYRFGNRTLFRHSNMGNTFDSIAKKAGLLPIPMVCNNMRASAEKDLYSGKYPELKGKVDLISKILGHSPQVALQFYSRFCKEDLQVLTDTFDMPENYGGRSERELPTGEKKTKYYDGEELPKELPTGKIISGIENNKKKWALQITGFNAVSNTENTELLYQVPPTGLGKICSERDYNKDTLRSSYLLSIKLSKRPSAYES